MRDGAMKRLDTFEGEWKLELIHPHYQSIYGQTSFAWMDGGQFMIQRTNVDRPEFPSSMLVYDYDLNDGTYLQHYFGSRGVARLYNMSLEDGIWKMWRNSSDFSSLDFSQRFFGEIKESGNTIHSTWEKSYDGVNWEHDFSIIYRNIHR